MTSPEEVRKALHATADTAQELDVDAVWNRVSTGITRRRRQRQALGVAGAALAVVALALGTQALDAPGRTAPARPAAVTTAASPVPQASPASPVPQASPASPVSPVPLADVVLPCTPEQARRAFTAAGYRDADAVQLGRVWRWGFVDEIEVVAGLQLLQGRTLPLRPGQAAPASPPGQPAIFRTKAAYADAGYADADTAALAARWGEGSTDLVEVFVGQVLLDGGLDVAGSPRSAPPG